MARLVAVVLLALIGADFVSDATCDLPEPLAAEAAVLTPPAGGAATPEACADVCIPDCFCCARSVAPGEPLVPPAPVPLASLAPATVLRGPDGFRLVVDRPPLLLG